MSVMLELYLEEIKQQLKPLPKQQREAELREIESHLGAMIEAKQADGMLYGEAVCAAIRQFGCPHRVGYDLSSAWERRTREHPLRAVAAALGTIVCQSALIMLYGWSASLVMNASQEGTLFAPFAERTLAVLTGALLLSPIVTGFLAQSIAPRRGSVAALTVYLTYIAVLLATMVLWEGRGVGRGFLPIFLCLPGVAFGAWLGKRGRWRRQERLAELPLTVG